MPYDYDILIAGAGPAGCAAAYDLARAGRRVLLIDRRTFPRPKACACGLTRKTLKVLRYSVDPVLERVCHEIVLQRTGVKQNQAGVPDTASGIGVCTNLPAADRTLEVRVRARNPICAMAERERFDAFCLQQTLAAGAHFCKIETLAALREHPTHIELDLVVDGTTQTLTAPVLIGADGSNGQTRRFAEARVQVPEEHKVQTGPGPLDPLPPAQDPVWYTRGFALEALIPYTSLPNQLPAGDAPHDLVFDFSPLPGGYGWLFPKGDHINIGVGAFAPAGDTGAEAPDLSAAMRAATDARLKQVTRQLLASYIRQKLGIPLPKSVTGQHLGMGGQNYVPRGRVLLTGDAAGLVDPLTGEGIHSAIVSGQAAAAAILETPGSEPGNLDTAHAYARRLAPLQQTLAFSHRAAHSFYRDPGRGFRAMRLPILSSLILKTYADGLPHTRLLTALAKLV